jgi:hypothetical protein
MSGSLSAASCHQAHFRSHVDQGSAAEQAFKLGLRGRRRVRERDLPLKIAAAGGSIGGLCAGIALRGIGCAVDVYERSPGAMASRVAAAW